MKLIDFLHEMVGSTFKYFSDVRDVGEEMIVRMSGGRVARLRLTDPFVKGHYEAVCIKLFDKMSGKIDEIQILFGDVFDSIRDLNHPNKIGKHIWENNGIYSWYGKPTAKDIEDMRKAIGDYIDMVE